MARDPYYDPEYDEGSDRKPAVFMLVLGVLTLALTILCLVLTFRLRSANAEITTLEQELQTARDELASSSLWTQPADPGTELTPMETAAPEVTPIPTATPEPTAEPTATPEPTPTPGAVELDEDGLPSWISKSEVSSVQRLPKADEWYSAPGKMYSTADLGLNMRYGPSTDYNISKTVKPKGSVLTVYAECGNWYFCKDADGFFGWANSKFLSDEAPEGTSIEAPQVSEDPTPTDEPEPPATAEPQS